VVDYIVPSFEDTFSLLKTRSQEQKRWQDFWFWHLADNTRVAVALGHKTSRKGFYS
jgi:hypothetical protein